MGKIVWDQTGEKKFYTGVEKGVLYPYNTETRAYTNGVGWNGLTNVKESPSGAEATELWADDLKYGEIRSAEKFGGTIEAYMYPDEFAELDGKASLGTGVRIRQQKRGLFGLSYVTLIGNDTEGTDYGYELHLVYGATASPSEKENQTVNDSPDAATLSWEFSTTPVSVNGHKPTSVLDIDSTTINEDKLAAIEAILYGTDAVYTKTSDETMQSGKTYYELSNGAYVATSDESFTEGKDYYELTSAATEPRLPLPDEVYEILNA